jgi:hypothetical protein
VALEKTEKAVPLKKKQKIKKEWETIRERQNFPSVAGFPECKKSGTWQSQSSPSVALGEE